MKRLLILFFAALLWAPVSMAQITEDISDVTGEYRISSDSMNDLWIDSYAGDYGAYIARYVSNPVTGSDQWMLILYGFTDEETTLSTSNDVTVEINGSTLRPLEVNTRTRALDDNEIMEVKETHFSQSVFQRIANADEVRITVGNESFQLPERPDMQLVAQAALLEDNGEHTASSEDQ